MNLKALLFIKLKLESLARTILKTKEQVQGIFRIDQANFQDIMLSLKLFFSCEMGLAFKNFSNAIFFLKEAEVLRTVVFGANLIYHYSMTYKEPV